MDFSEKKKEEKNKNTNTNIQTNIYTENLLPKNELKKKNKAEEDSMKKLQDEVIIKIL